LKGRRHATIANVDDEDPPHTRSDVINMDTVPETVLYERKERGMQPLPTLMKIHLTPDLILLKNSFSSQCSCLKVSTPT
jgi:hypothetical protein